MLVQSRKLKKIKKLRPSNPAIPLAYQNNLQAYTEPYFAEH
jgi:hypothetical protein